MLEYAEPVTKLIDELKRLPSIGHKSAQRLAFHVMRASEADLERLIAAFANAGGEAIIAPLHGGKRGNPVLWPRVYFGEMLQLEGDAGAGRLLATHADKVRGLELGTDAVLADVDTPEALSRLRSLSPPAERGSG